MTLLPQRFPPVGVWSLITQFFRLMACYVSNGPLFQPGSCWGDARPQQPWCVKQLNASSPLNAKMTHLPMSWLQLCGGTQLNMGERSHVCSHTRARISVTDLYELQHSPWGDGKCFHKRIDNVVSALSQHVRLQAGSERDVPGCWRGAVIELSRHRSPHPLKRVTDKLQIRAKSCAKLNPGLSRGSTSWSQVAVNIFHSRQKAGPTANKSYAVMFNERASGLETTGRGHRRGCFRIVLPRFGLLSSNIPA